MTYRVWLFTRPLSCTTLFPSSELTSDGRNYMRHWGVLINELNPVDFQVIMERTRDYCWSETSLGTMYELFRDTRHNNLKLTRPFMIKTIRTEWRAFSSEYLGETEMDYEAIEQIGNCPLFLLIFFFHLRGS
jgi:hypothetical protein